MPLYQSLTDAKSGMVKELHRWWDDHRQGDVPDRAELNPADFTRMLPNLLIADVQHAPFRVRFRLVGTRVTTVTGFGITGRYVDELVPTDTTEDWNGLYRVAYDLRRPVFGFCTASTTRGGQFTYEFGLFPLRKGAATIEQFVSVEDYLGQVPYLAEFVPWEHVVKSTLR